MDQVLCDLPYGRQYGTEAVARPILDYFGWGAYHGLRMRLHPNIFQEKAPRTWQANHELYAAALLDIARVLKPSGRSFTAFRLSGEPL